MKDRILIIDDDTHVLKSLERTLRLAGYEARQLNEPHRTIQAIADFQPAVVLLDVRMPISGLDLLKAITQHGFDVEVILMTGYASLDLAVQAVKDGAFDFIPKPFDHPETLLLKITRALERRILIRRARELDGAAALDLPFVLGNSKHMADVMRVVGRVAPTDSTVLITGETGTGKEVIARAIHRYSNRVAKPFLAVNCSALSDQLIESELFGHERGSFTGAVSRRDGLFIEAHKATLFLDEIGEMPLALQAKLLRVLQEQEVRRVGSNQTTKVDVRVLAATNRNLEEQVAEGTFREDLYYRLHVVNIQIPPLRERMPDIAPLTGFFLRKLQEGIDEAKRKTLSPAVLELFERYAWPGNVRELENAIQRAIVLSEGTQIQPHVLPTQLLSKIRFHGIQLSARIDLEYQAAKHQYVESFDRTYVNALLERFGRRLSEAASFAGMDRSNFRKLVLKVEAQTGAITGKARVRENEGAKPEPQLAIEVFS